MTTKYKPMKFLWCSCGIRLRGADDEVLARKWEKHRQGCNPTQLHMPRQQEAQ